MDTKNKYIESFKVIGIFMLVVILLLSKCDKKLIEEKDVGVFEETVVNYVTYRDTVPFYYSVPRYYDVPIEKPIYTVSVSEDIKDSVLTYSNNITDSLLEGIIYTEVKTDGTMVLQNLEYTPLFPKYIYQTDSIFTTTTKTIKKKEWGVYIGGQYILDLNNNYVEISPSIGLETRNNWFIYGGYGLINKSVSIGVQKKISLKK